MISERDDSPSQVVQDELLLRRHPPLRGLQVERLEAVPLSGLEGRHGLDDDAEVLARRTGKILGIVITFGDVLR